ncbi:MAG: hypothetical protein EP330_27405 [Deltaproteobacteria bacterium]|nr:MAG: hypothetical protein EP330_27405 [Deltaproteobacteria bacterium]
MNHRLTDFELSESPGVREARWLGWRRPGVFAWSGLGLFLGSVGAVLVTWGGLAPWSVALAAVWAAGAVALSEPRLVGPARLTVSPFGAVNVAGPGGEMRMLTLDGVSRLSGRRLRLRGTLGESVDIDLSAYPFACVEALGEMLDRARREARQREI